MARRARRYWLMKSEPEVYSIQDLERDGRTPRDSVRNYQARNTMRDEMAPGDQRTPADSRTTGKLGRIASIAPMMAP